MRRHFCEAWCGFEAEADRLGYDYHRTPNGSAWCNDAYYAFSEAEVERIEAATTEVHGLCLCLVDAVCAEPDRMARFGIPDWLRDLVVLSWRERALHPHLLGRLDLMLDLNGTPRLLEYNADTPTTAIETATVQWQWFSAGIGGPGDQFTRLHEAISERFRFIRSNCPERFSHLTLAPYPNSLEDFRHCEYYAELAREAGMTTSIIQLAKTGRRRADNQFQEPDGRPMTALLKLYPWEMMVKDRFAPFLLQGKLSLLEPAWKMLLSSKAILPELWAMFPGHPNLLESYWDQAGMTDFVRKPIFSREGQNITVVRNNDVATQTEGTYGDYPPVFQRYLDAPRWNTGGRQAVIGSWLVGDAAEGIIVRETDGDVVRNESCCVPHVIDDSRA